MAVNQDRVRKAGGTKIVLLVVVVLLALAIGAYVFFSPKPSGAVSRAGTESVSGFTRAAGSKQAEVDDVYINISDDAVERARLAELMPESGYKSLARQQYKVMEWDNMPGMDRGREYAISHVLVNTGPLGILVLRDRKKMTYTVKDVDSGSPADGVLQLGDVIIGIGKKKFGDIPGDEIYRHHFPNLQFGRAVNEAESRKDGRLELLIRRNGAEKTVAVRLVPLGPDGEHWGGKNPKADYLIDLNARILASKQLANGWWDCGYSQKHCRYPAGRKDLYNSCMAGLALMVADADKYHANVRRLADAMIKMNDANYYEPWQVCYRALFLGEYYLRYHDQRAFDKLEELVNGAINGALFYEGSYGWGHCYGGNDYRYGGIAMCTCHAMLAVAIGKTAGVKISPEMDRKLTKTIERISPDGFISYAERPQILGDALEIKPFNQHGGRTGMGTIGYRLMGGRLKHIEKMLHYLEMNEAYNDSSHGGGHEFCWVWSTLALGILDDDQYQRHLKKWQWYFDFNRKWNGGYYVQPDPACIERRYEMFGPTFYAATYIMILGHYRHNLAITGCKKYLLPADQYSKPPLPSLLLAERYNQLVRISAVITQINIGRVKIPASIVKLFKSLKAIPIESAGWNARAEKCYHRHLKQVAHDILQSQLATDQKAQAVLTLLGIRPYISGVRSLPKRGQFSFSLASFPAYIGKYSVTPRLIFDGHTYTGHKLTVEAVLPEAAAIRRKFGQYNFKKGISAHAPSSLVFNLNGKYSRFTALGGLWDPAYGSCGFKVFGDDRQLFSSRVVRKVSDPIAVDVDVRGIQQLRLVTTAGGDGNNGDHSIWFDAQLTTLGGMREPLLVKNALSAKTGWSKASQNRHFSGEPLDLHYEPNRAVVKNTLKIKVSKTVLQHIANGTSELILDFDWQGEKISLPLDIVLPAEPVKVVDKKSWSMMPWDIQYGPYDGHLLKLARTMRLKMPGGVIWESDVTAMSVSKDGHKYPVRAYLKKFGEPNLGCRVRVYHANQHSSDYKGAFMSLELR